MSLAELRALARLGRRTARREWKRTVLIAALVAVPVAAALVVAGIVAANDLSPEERIAGTYGAADIKIEAFLGGGFGREADFEAWLDDTLSELAPGADVLTFRQQWNRQLGYLVDLDIEHPVADGMLTPWEGRLPTATGEVAVSPRSLRELDAVIGDTVELASGEPLTIVGTVVDPISYNRELAVVAPAQFDRLEAVADHREGTSRLWLVAGVDDGEPVADRFNQRWEAAKSSFLPEPAIVPRPDALVSLPDELYASLTAPQIERLAAEAATLELGQLEERAWQMAHDHVGFPQPWASSREVELGYNAGSLSDQLLTPAVVATLVAGVLLAEVALVAGAAYATGARRRLRELGLLGSNGATVGHIRVAVLGEAFVAGVVGTLAGVALGLAALVVGRPLIQLVVARYLTGVPVSLGAVVGPALAGVGAVLVAAWLPARTAARVPTVTALHGRMPLSAPPRWLVPVGMVLFGFGGLMTTVALAAGGGDAAPALAVIGILTAIIGMAVLTPPIIARIGRFADSLPATARLVVRDSARQRTRAAAATAAAMVLLMAPVLIGFASSTEEAQNQVRGLPVPDDQVVFAPGGWMNQRPAPQAAPDEVADPDYASSLAALRGELAGATETTVPVMYGFAVPETAPDPTIASREYGRYDENTLAPWEVTIGLATSAVVDALGDDRVAAAIDDGSPVVLGVEERDTSVRLENGRQVEAREIPVPVLWSFPRLLLPPAVAGELGLEASQELALFTQVDLAGGDDELWEVVTAGDLAVGYSMVSPVQMRWMGVGATLLVVLLTLALVTALSTTESDHDLRTMVAVGAAPRIRRRFLALQTGYHALVGAVLAVPLGAGLFWAATRSNPWSAVGPFGVRMSDALAVPWLVLLAVVIGVPLVIGGLTAGVFRSAPTVPPRRVG